MPARTPAVIYASLEAGAHLKRTDERRHFAGINVRRLSAGSAGILPAGSQ
ncbi:hypothetical protein L0222_00930 [bacterium]|nr:hypothetical protein [bacterium]